MTLACNSFLTRGEKNDDFHADVLKVVDLEPPQLVGEVEHLLHALLDPVLPGARQSQRLLVGHPNHARRRRDGAVAARENEELAPGVDQQSDLVIDLRG